MKRWVRHHQSGQLGSLIEKDGTLFVQLDRPGSSKAHEQIPYRPKEWLHDSPPPPMTANMLAQVQFAADVELCKQLGHYKLSQREWASMTDEVRIEWVEKGPDAAKHPARARLWYAVKLALERLTNAPV